MLAQNSRDFIFLRRYRYMFALKKDKVASALKKKVGLEKQGPMEEGEDEVIRARFQEIGPRMTVKMRWVRRGALGETGNERNDREKAEKAAGLVSEVSPDEEMEGAEKDNGEDGEEEDEKEAAAEIGITEGDVDGQPNFDFNSVAKAAEASSAASTSAPVEPKVKVRKPRTVPRKRKLAYHALLRPPPSPSPPPGFVDSEPAPLPSKDGKIKERSLLSTVGKTWHAGKGEGGVREGKKRREWGWEVRRPSSHCRRARLTVRIAGEDADVAQEVLHLSWWGIRVGLSFRPFYRPWWSSEAS